MSHPHRSDFGAALTGLVVGACLLFTIVFAIVTLTNRMYAGEATHESTK